jgi:hypothetical protein
MVQQLTNAANMTATVIYGLVTRNILLAYNTVHSVDLREKPMADNQINNRVFVVLIEDRHADVDVEVYTDRDKAIARGRELAKEYCRYEDDYEENTNPAWLFNATYSCEGDNITVYERELL